MKSNIDFNNFDTSKILESQMCEILNKMNHHNWKQCQCE